jgi:hypothetical protein
MVFTIPHIVNGVVQQQMAVNGALNVNPHHYHHPNSVCVGIPMNMRRQQSVMVPSVMGRRMSMMRALPMSGGAGEGAVNPNDTSNMNNQSEEDEEMNRETVLNMTQQELYQIEQQMMMMMESNEGGDAASVGSSDSNIQDMEDNMAFHQDLSAAAADKNSYCSSFSAARSQTIADHEQCYVILFGMGSEETEGIYTLRTVEYEDGDVVNVDTVVAFANEVDAQRFATLLEASLKHHPAVYSTSWGDITEWCEENNAKCRLEPSGSLLIPPESNVSVTDWERALALQRGEYSVLEEEPARAGPIMNLDSSSVDKEHDIVFKMDVEEEQLFESMFDFHHVGNSSDQDNVSNIVDSRLANASLNSVREELERLLGNSC